MKKEMLEKAEAGIQKTASPTPDRAKLDEALNRIYEQYGSDLPAFFRDAYREIAAKRRDMERHAKNEA